MVPAAVQRRLRRRRVAAGGQQGSPGIIKAVVAGVVPAVAAGARADRGLDLTFRVGDGGGAPASYSS